MSPTKTKAAPADVGAAVERVRTLRRELEDAEPAAAEARTWAVRLRREIDEKAGARTAELVELRRRLAVAEGRIDGDEGRVLALHEQITAAIRDEFTGRRAKLYADLASWLGYRVPAVQAEDAAAKVTSRAPVHLGREWDATAAELYGSIERNRRALQERYARDEVLRHLAGFALDGFEFEQWSDVNPHDADALRADADHFAALAAETK